MLSDIMEHDHVEVTVITATHIKMTHLKSNTACPEDNKFIKYKTSNFAIVFIIILDLINCNLAYSKYLGAK